MNINLQKYLCHSILGFLMAIGSSSAFAGAEVYHDTNYYAACFDFPSADNPHTFCETENTVWTKIETPSGNVIYKAKREMTQSYTSLGEATPYFENVVSSKLHTVKKADDLEDHVYLYSAATEVCIAGSRKITTNEYRFVNGRVVRENTVIEQIPC